MERRIAQKAKVFSLWMKVILFDETCNFCQSHTYFLPQRMECHKVNCSEQIYLASSHYKSRLKKQKHFPDFRTGRNSTRGFSYQFNHHIYEVSTRGIGTNFQFICSFARLFVLVFYFIIGLLK